MDSIKETVYQGTLDPLPKALFANNGKCTLQANSRNNMRYGSDIVTEIQGASIIPFPS